MVLKRVVALCWGGLLAASVWAQSTPVGLWKTAIEPGYKAQLLVRIDQDAAGVYRAKIEKIMGASRTQNLDCDKCLDDRKDQPLLGLEVIRGVQKNAAQDNVWDGGKILDPQTGHSYKVRLALRQDGAQLQVRAYVGKPDTGRSQVWTRQE